MLALSLENVESLPRTMCSRNPRHGLLSMLLFLSSALVSSGVEEGKPVPVTGEAVAFDSFTYTGRDLPEGDKLADGHFRNPVLAGFFPDPSICRVGYDYYLVNSTFAYYPGLPIFHSRDLVNWKLAGHAISRPDQLDYRKTAVTRGLFAPALEYHKGTFYLVCTMIDGKGNFVMTAKDPAGPWSDPVWLDFPGIDPSLFFDEDGRTWLVHNGDAPENKPFYQGHRAVWLRGFDPVAMRMTGEARILVNGGVDLSKKPVWIEGPHLFKKSGWYYLTCAEGGTGPDHSQVVFRSREVTGPFEPWSGNPILTQRDLDPEQPDSVTCTGHADLVEGPDGKWWSVFLGCRPFAKGDIFTTGRETFILPVTWTEDGWPSILPAGKRVPLVVASPLGATPAADHAPLNGDFTFTENFDRPGLDPLWLMLRSPVEKPLSHVDGSRGALMLEPVAATLSGVDHPAFLSRRVQHARFTASTVLEVPAQSATTAGLALFQSEKNYYFLAVEKDAEEKAWITIELADSGSPSVIHRVPAPDGKLLHLRLRADLGDLALEWSPDGETWTTHAAPAGIAPVTVKAAGGGLHFTGAVVGLHARKASNN